MRRKNTVTEFLNVDLDIRANTGDLDGFLRSIEPSTRMGRALRETHRRHERNLMGIAGAPPILRTDAFPSLWPFANASEIGESTFAPVSI
jgi:hypothetical protein